MTHSPVHRTPPSLPLPMTSPPSTTPSRTLRLPLALVLALLIALPPPALAAKNRTLELYECLRDADVGPSVMSLPGSDDFALALTQTLIQDPRHVPQVIFRPATTGGVVKAVKCAKKTGAKICARSGGHSWSASSMCPGLLVDLQRLNSLKVNGGGNAVKVGAGKTTGEIQYTLYTTTGKIIPTGTCPSVGVGGYVQGGGMGTLAGKLGLLSDNVKYMTVVLPGGKIVKATKTHYGALFWGLTGGGGGNLGIVTEIGIRIHNAIGTFDNNVHFGFSWDMKHAAEALHKWTQYPIADDGNLYIRMTLRATRDGGSEVRAVGMCWQVSSVDECTQKLSALSLWDVPGRQTQILRKATQGVMEVNKFLTSDGQYGRAKATGPWNTEAIMTQRYVTKAFLSDRSWSSRMLSEDIMNSTRKYFQGLLDITAKARRDADMRSISMEIYPMGRQVRKMPADYSAFAHRHALAVMAAFYYGGTTEQRAIAKKRIQKYFEPYGCGTYVNYQDLDLDRTEYPKQYWGSNLSKLKELKEKFDPDGRMWHPMSIP